MNCPDHPQASPANGGEKKPLPYFTIYHFGKYIILFKANVAYAEGAHECTVITMQSGEKYTVNGNIGYWKAKLNDTGIFISPHKSWMLNPASIEYFNGPDGIVMRGNEKKVFDIGEKMLRRVRELSNYIHPPCQHSSNAEGTDKIRSI